MSLETRLAQGAARDAEAEWKRHAVNCPRCARLARNRHEEPCSIGAPIRREARQLRAAAKRKAELDKQVPAGQEALF